MENELKKRIEALEKWKEERTRQQIVFPLDIQSITTLQKYFMRILNTVLTTTGSGNTFVTYTGKQGSINFQVGIDTFIPYTVNISTNFITAASGDFPDDTAVYVATEDTFPNPLSDAFTFFVINSTGLTFQLSLTQNGSAIDITTTGTGRQYIYYF